MLSAPAMSVIPFTFFFFNDTATTEIYTLSLHDALPIYFTLNMVNARRPTEPAGATNIKIESPLLGVLCEQYYYTRVSTYSCRSEEHTSELQSRQYLVCRLLLEKKKHNQSTLLFQSTSYS